MKKMSRQEQIIWLIAGIMAGVVFWSVVLALVILKKI
jgi:hypothetical protein